MLGDIVCEENDLDAALGYAERGVEICEQRDYIVPLCLAYKILLRIYLARKEKKQSCGNGPV